MSGRSTVNSHMNPGWRKLLLLGAAATLLSIMVGILLQTVFYEVVNNIPSIVKQDAHISLTLCKVFPNLSGCDPWIGVMTSLEIWEISQEVGQIGGLLVNLMLTIYFSINIATRKKEEEVLAGLYLGLFGLIFSLFLVMIIKIPLNFSNVSSVVKILMILSLPLGGYLGAIIGFQMHSKRYSSKIRQFFPVVNAEKMDGVVENLSDRELEVLVLVAEGFTNHEIANRLYISHATVKTHLQHIFGKLGVTNRTAAVTQALSYGYLRQETTPDEDHSKAANHK